MRIGAEHNVEGADAYEAIVIYGENTSLRALCHLLQNCAAGTSGFGSIRLPRIETTLRGMSAMCSGFCTSAETTSEDRLNSGQ